MTCGRGRPAGATNISPAALCGGMLASRLAGGYVPLRSGHPGRMPAEDGAYARRHPSCSRSPSAAAAGRFPRHHRRSSLGQVWPNSQRLARSR